MNDNLINRPSLKFIKIINIDKKNLINIKYMNICDILEFDDTVNIDCKVKKAKNISTGKNVAVKIIDKDEDYENEILVLNQLSKNNHENIIKVFDIFQDTNNIYIIQDYWKEDLLTFVINSYNNTILSEDLVKNIIRQILFGVKHCHDNNIIHNDLKLENILYNNNQTK